MICLLDHDPSTHQWLVLLEGTVISSSYKIDRMLNVIFINIHHQTYNKNIIDIITLLNSTMWIVVYHRITYYKAHGSAAKVTEL